MLKEISTSASLNAPTFDLSNYSFNTTKPKWFTNHAYAHFGNGAFGVNG